MSEQKLKELELKYFKLKCKRQQTFSKEENITMKVLEGLISRWITRLYCIFATFPTRGPRGLLCYVRQPRPSLLSGRNPMALPGTRGGVGASLTFLIQKNTTLFHLPAKPLE